MKTTTYLRLSLLIPFLVWGICVLMVMLFARLGNNGSNLNESTSFKVLLLWSVLFYVFGIVGWFLPYLLLSLVLLVWSFTSRAEPRVLIRVFALSPLAMAIVILFVVNVVPLAAQNPDMFSAVPTPDPGNLIVANLWYMLLALSWGYLCVGIGFSLYSVLQRRGFIKDGMMASSMPAGEPA
jgi:hypothetical protein